MECMCTQTRRRFILSSERVFGRMESEPMLTPREKFPLPEKNLPRGGSNRRRCIKQDSEPNTLATSYPGPSPGIDFRLCSASLGPDHLQISAENSSSPVSPDRGRENVSQLPLYVDALVCAAFYSSYHSMALSATWKVDGAAYVWGMWSVR